ncbi:putative thaumatin, tRNA-dihydrouridine synthase [Rosa chinensis]|uniref:Putative thaumatin, tRNA-dihydrouridine synthase n=1 Tax=Rosa chinensis TaxID=74649 RepID=A0A2P6PZ74_ROSCH|nr:thaumatin-like protein 1 [Rosa chinensis]PRQ27223.1 putative thaumatin, tRNA-dihydrouridine synthase [Rosa chinensis]
MSIFRCPLQIILIVSLISFQTSVNSTTFTFTNRCDYTVYPGTLAGSSSPRLESTGFQLQPGESRSLQAPPSWSGRFWGRTGCNFDPVTGQGSCTTADCGSNQLECNGAGAVPPATLAEFTIGSGDAKDFYDVSLVDGFNLPMLVEPSGGSGDCSSTGCAVNLNKGCPSELQFEGGAGCRSACEAFQTPEYCCSGAYGSPSTCKPSVYSQMFKAACPTAYSYAYDDGTSTFTCSGADYIITFCPSSTTSLKSSTPTTSTLPTSPTTTVTPPMPTQKAPSVSPPTMTPPRPTTTVTPPLPTGTTATPTAPATPTRATDGTGGGYVMDYFGSSPSFSGDASKTLASIAMAASSVLFYFLLV